MAQLEHIFTFAKTSNIDSYLKKYKKAGFVVQKKTYRHPPGARNGFVSIGREYIEFFWIEDESAYRREKSSYHDQFRRYPGPYGFGFEEPRIEKFHASLIRRGIKVPKLESRGQRGEDKAQKLLWTFQWLNPKLVPGVYPFVLRYASRTLGKKRESHVGANRIFAISGVTFVTESPKKDAAAWHKIFGGRTRSAKADARLALGPHMLEWLTPVAYRKKYAREPQLPASGKFASMRKMALLHLLSDDLPTTIRVLRRGGRVVERRMLAGEDLLFVMPLKTDGYAFVVHKAERVAK